MLATARLTLRRPEASDAEAIFSRWASDPEATRWLGWPMHRSIEDTRGFLEFANREWQERGFGPYLIFEGTDLVGSTGLHAETEWRAETGYVLTKSAWGRGIATEALAAMVELAPKVGLQRLEARCHVEHRASARVLEKCGFTMEGVLRKYTLFPNLGRGVPEDVQSWAKIF